MSPWTGVREEKDGSYLIATSRGLARYRPEGERPQEIHPNVQLTKVMLGGQERLPEETPKVRSSDGSLVVQFSPMILGNSGRVSCQYELQGLEQQATETQQREMQYGGLPPGHYQFWVQCHEPSLEQASSPRYFDSRWHQTSGRPGGRAWWEDSRCWDVSGVMHHFGHGH